MHEKLDHLLAHDDQPRLVHWDIWNTNILARTNGDGKYHIAALLDPNCKFAHAEAEIAYGDPASEIVKWVKQKGCDLVAMSTHGHRFLADIFLGTTASRVQHNISVPVLLLRAK